ncbi:MAG: EAL domain-containing protein (putative c-di-GMP-specific phosphodiesterase class I) [Psychrobacter glaciei]
MAKSFNCEVIAKDVETIEHRRALLELGCDLAQGYGIVKPMLAHDVITWIINWEPDDSWNFSQ